MLLIALAVVCAVLVVLNILRIQETERVGSQPVSTYLPPALQATGRPAAPPTVTVLADGNAKAADPLPAIDALRRTLSEADIRIASSPGLRYVARRSGDPNTFAVRVRSIDRASVAVVLYGGTNDRGGLGFTLADAVTRAISAAKAQAPHAQVVLVGPLGPAHGSPPQALLTLRDTLRSAAQATSAQWVDPMSAHWWQHGSSLATADGLATTAGKQEFGRLLAEAVRPYVTART